MSSSSTITATTSAWILRPQPGNSAAITDVRPSVMPACEMSPVQKRPAR